jgi:hypothetical protein
MLVISERGVSLPTKFPSIANLWKVADSFMLGNTLYMSLANIYPNDTPNMIKEKMRGFASRANSYEIDTPLLAFIKDFERLIGTPISVLTPDEFLYDQKRPKADIQLDIKAYFPRKWEELKQYFLTYNIPGFARAEDQVAKRA